MDFTRYFDHNNNFESQMLFDDITDFVTINKQLIWLGTLMFFNLLINLSIGYSQSYKIKELNKQLDNINEENQELSTSNEELNTSNEELKAENENLEDKVKTMNTELENLHQEFVKLNKTISMLQERNQILCESLGDFLRYKRRKTAHDFMEDPPVHPYNLRARKPVNYNEEDKEEGDEFDVLTEGK
jgi:septal ring factor EnvC (AmiA/AmiB activator)